MAKYVKPTLKTKFHIDFAWWQKKGKNLRADLQSHACPEVKDLYADYKEDPDFDWINPETGEVFKIDVLWYLLHEHCKEYPDFINEFTPLTTAIFRVFIANDNTPLTAVEIHEKLQKKTPDLILRTIGGHRVYKGIRPVVMPV
jgi:hypothetical protein